MGTPHHHAPRRPHAHPAHPLPPAHFQPPVTPAPVKQIEDPRWVISDLNDIINVAAIAWRRFAYALGGAYSWGWHTQGAVLKKVKDNLETRAKAEEAAAMFALSMLTIGLGGPLANFCAKKVLGTYAEQLGEKFVEDVVDKATEQGKELMKSKGEWLYKYLNHPPSEEAFAPAGVEPLQFQDSMLEGIEFRTATLLKLTQKLKEKLAGGATLGNLQEIYNSIVTTPFIAQPPSLHITKESLQVKALMALWISWGWGRDVGYWRSHSFLLGKTVGEAIDFEPVRKSLLASGVPESRISQAFLSGGGAAWVMSRDAQKLREDQKTNDVQVINMSAFIDWCNSDDCVEVLLHGLPRNIQWFQEIKQQLTMRRLMGPYAAYMTSSSGE